MAPPREAWAVAATLLAGCAVGPDYQRPDVAVPAQFQSQPALAAVDGAAEAAWWSRLGDPMLDALVAEALAANYDVVAAAARVERFHGLAGVTRSALYPQLGVGADASRNRVSGRTVSPQPVPNPYDLLQANLLASWEIDLFGRVRRESEAAQADLRASEEFRRGTVLSLVAAVAGGYVHLRDLDRQLEVANETLQTRSAALNVFERRFRGGVVSEVEVSQARSEYFAALRSVPVLEQAVAQQE